MEKKFPPRVWLPESAIQAFSRRMASSFNMDQTHFISVEEHQALIAPLIEALKRYETAGFDVNGQMFSVGSVAREALENYKKQTGVKDEKSST